jgi:hypothetical protein
LVLEPRIFRTGRVLSFSPTAAGRNIVVLFVQFSQRLSCYKKGKSRFDCDKQDKIVEHQQSEANEANGLHSKCKVSMKREIQLRQYGKLGLFSPYRRDVTQNPVVWTRPMLMTRTQFTEDKVGRIYFAVHCVASLQASDGIRAFISRFRYPSTSGPGERAKCLPSRVRSCGCPTRPQWFRWAHWQIGPGWHCQWHVCVARRAP